MFFAGFGFLTAVIFLPRWFQAVAGESATVSGYSLLPLLVALIVSATMSGQIVARIGRYKWLMFGSLVLLAVALFLMTNLRSTTDRPVLWLWMALAGLGIGPSFAAEEVPGVVQALIDIYREHRAANERFVDTARRIGVAPFRAAADLVRRETAVAA